MTDIERAVRRAERERLARKQAESLLEQKSLELYQSNLDLKRVRDELEQRVILRTQQLESALQAAEASNRVKGEFLANMSHEIRTPMTAILGYADLLLEDQQQVAENGTAKVSLDRCEIIRTIQKNGHHLLEIINDILDLSKIEAGKLDLHYSSCSISELVNSVLALMKVRSQAKGLALVVEYENIHHDQISTDETRLRQILVNLIGNSIKFTEHGSVSLLVRSICDPVENQQMVLEFHVTDTGIGMTPQAAGRLFQPFTQADSSMTRRYGGTGLGLTISRSLAEMFQGRLEILSTEVGKGSHFCLTIPYKAITQAPTAIRIQNRVITKQKTEEFNRDLPLKGLRILLAEDGLDNQRLIAHVLRKSGADVTICDNGQIAVDQMTSSMQSGHPFDVVLMDMQMPVLDGYRASRILRDMECPAPIIALTAHAMSEDRKKCLDAGADDYTTKPINRSELIGQIVKHSNIESPALTL